MALKKSTVSSLLEELVCTIRLPLNTFSFVLAEIQEGGIQFPFIIQAEKRPETGRNKVDIERSGREEAEQAGRSAEDHERACEFQCLLTWAQIATD